MTIDRNEILLVCNSIVITFCPVSMACNALMESTRELESHAGIYVAVKVSSFKNKNLVHVSHHEKLRCSTALREAMSMKTTSETADNWFAIAN